MNKLIIVFLFYSALVLVNCGAVRSSKSGYRIKGEFSQTVLIDDQLNGTSKISGFVYSKIDSTLLSGANILFTEDIGITSDKNGEFKIELTPDNYFVKASFIGHDDLEISELKLLANQHAILIIELGTTSIY